MRRFRTHPMVLIAAVAVTIFSIVGVAAITGWIPTAHSEKIDQLQSATPDGNATTLDTQTANSLPSATAGKSIHAGANEPPLARNEKQGACSDCGVIESIRVVRHESQGNGPGAVADGVTGGLTGNQVGNGNTLLTNLGASGGVLAGNAIEKNMKSIRAYRTRIHMQDGTYRNVTQTTHPEYAIGDHVKVVSGHVAIT